MRRTPIGIMNPMEDRRITSEQWWQVCTDLGLDGKYERVLWRKLCGGKPTPDVIVGSSAVRRICEQLGWNITHADRIWQQIQLRSDPVQSAPLDLLHETSDVIAPPAFDEPPNQADAGDDRPELHDQPGSPQPLPWEPPGVDDAAVLAEIPAELPDAARYIAEDRGPLAQTAGWPRRALAAIIDLTLVTAITVAAIVACVTVSGAKLNDADSCDTAQSVAASGGDCNARLADFIGVLGTTIVVLTLIAFMTPVVYQLLVVRGHRGQTPGRTALGIRLISQDGAAVTWRDVLMREIIGKLIVPGLTVVIAGTLLTLVVGESSPVPIIASVVFVGWWWVIAPVLDAEGRAPHDRIAATRVIRA